MEIKSKEFINYIDDEEKPYIIACDGYNIVRVEVTFERFTRLLTGMMKRYLRMLDCAKMCKRKKK